MFLVMLHGKGIVIAAILVSLLYGKSLFGCISLRACMKGEN